MDTPSTSRRAPATGVEALEQQQFYLTPSFGFFAEEAGGINATIVRH
jgi:hypothetical protein